MLTTDLAEVASHTKPGLKAGLAARDLIVRVDLLHRFIGVVHGSDEHSKEGQGINRDTDITQVNERTGEDDTDPKPTVDQAPTNESRGTLNTLVVTAAGDARAAPGGEAEECTAGLSAASKQIIPSKIMLKYIF